jgi:hypothetical protein
MSISDPGDDPCRSAQGDAPGHYLQVEPRAHRPRGQLYWEIPPMQSGSKRATLESASRSFDRILRGDRFRRTSSPTCQSAPFCWRSRFESPSSPRCADRPVPRY